MMTFDEFKKKIGDKHAIVMNAHQDTSHMGIKYAKGQGSLFTTRVAYALYKQGWKPKNVMITGDEVAALNAHFEKENELETGKVKKIKTKS